MKFNFIILIILFLNIIIIPIVYRYFTPDLSDINCMFNYRVSINKTFNMLYDVKLYLDKNGNVVKCNENYTKILRCLDTNIFDPDNPCRIIYENIY